LVKRNIDDKIGALARSGKRNAARRLSVLLRGDKASGTRGLIDAIDEQVPAYRRARETFSGAAALEDAMELGRKLPTARNDLGGIETAVRAMSEGETHAFRMGALKGIAERLDDIADNRNAAETLIRTPRMRNLLRLAFPNKEAHEKFISVAEAESRFAFTRQRVLGGSPTARIQQETRFLEEGVPVAASIPVMMLRWIQKIGLRDTEPETLEEISKILFNPLVTEREISSGRIPMVIKNLIQTDPIIVRQGAAAGAVGALATGNQ